MGQSLTGKVPGSPSGGTARRTRWGPDAGYHYTDRARSWSTLSLLAITLLLLLSIGGSWWQAQFYSIPSGSDNPVQTVVIAFDLGGSVTCTTNGWASIYNPCANVTDSQPGVRGAVYSGINDALVALGAAGAIACLLAALGTFGVRIGRWQLTLEILLVLALTIGPVSLMAVSIGIGPGPQAASYCTFLSGNVTNCPLFWGGSSAGNIPGSCSTCFLTLGWGAGVSFYEALGAVILGSITAGFLVRGRRGPFTVAENAAWLATNEPLKLPPDPRHAVAGPGDPPPPEPPPRPPVSATHPRLKISGRPWTCPACGRVNSGWARICPSCRGERPPDVVSARGR